MIKSVPLSTPVLEVMSEDVEKYVVSLKLEGLAAILEVTIGEAIVVIPSPWPPAVVLLGLNAFDFVIE